MPSFSGGRGGGDLELDEEETREDEADTQTGAPAAVQERADGWLSDDGIDEW